MRHVSDDMPFTRDFDMAARGIELAKACYRNSAHYTWEILAQSG